MIINTTCSIGLPYTYDTKRKRKANMLTYQIQTSYSKILSEMKQTKFI